tara:strand:+ start:3806 stop:6460 length:2655 start_codon:yes stop_codon:yes gene_type:complete
MGINKNNNIRTDIKINSSGAVKGASRLFDKLKKGQADVTKGSAKASKSIKSVGNSAAASGTKGAKGFGFLAKGMAAAKTGILSMIPALGGLATAFAATGIGAIVIAVIALGAAMFGAIKKGAQFGKQISTLKGISGATSEEIGVLSKQAKQLGASTAFTATEVVKLQTELAKLGFSAGQVQAATPAILDLAASLDVDLASAAEFAGSTVRSFGLEATDTQRVVDVMAASATASAQSFGTLVESFKLAAPTARALGVSVEETGALLGALANNGLKGSIAGTGLSKVFIQLAKEGLTLEQGLEKVRGSSDKLNTAIDLVGVIGSKSLLTLAASGDDIERLQTQLEGAAGAAAALAETKLDNLSGDVTKLGSAWEGFILGIEDGTGILNQLARGAVQALTFSITHLTGALNFAGFMAKEMWGQMKDSTIGTGKIVGGAFVMLGATIKKFANNALLSISKIPILGSGIDKGAALRRVNEAANILKKGQELIEEGVTTLQTRAALNRTMKARYFEEQKNSQIAIANKQAQREKETADAEAIEAAKEAAAKAAKERAAQVEKDAKTLSKIREKIAKKEDDLLAKTDEEKLQLKRERQLAELDELLISATEKEEAQNEINEYFDNLRDEKKREKDAAAEEVRVAKQLELDALELERLLANDQLTFDEREALQLAYLDKKLANDLANEKLTAEEKEIINKKAEKAKDKVRKAEADASKALKNKVLNDALDGAAASFGIAQEVAVAKMLMAAPEAISGSFKEAAKAYAPPMSLAMGALGAAGTVAPIIKGLADIKKNRFSKGGKTSGAAPGGTINTSAISAGAAGISTDTVSSLAANNSARLGIDPSLGGAAGSAAANNVMGGASGNVVFSEAQYSSFQSQVGFVEDLTTVGG